MLSYRVSEIVRWQTRLTGSDEFIVEVDVILPQSSTLHFAHDVGETIQCVLERSVKGCQRLTVSLDGVLRAYVQ